MRWLATKFNECGQRFFRWIIKSKLYNEIVIFEAIFMHQSNATHFLNLLSLISSLRKHLKLKHCLASISGTKFVRHLGAVSSEIEYLSIGSNRGENVLFYIAIICIFDMLTMQMSWMEFTRCSIPNQMQQSRCHILPSLRTFFPYLRSLSECWIAYIYHTGRKLENCCVKASK